MIEPYGGGTGFRFKIRDVQIDGQGDTVEVRGGGPHQLSFDLLHDCPECGNAVNQVIVGLAGQDRAQSSVWNGKQRSGGGLRVVNPGTDVEALAEDNPGPAEWVRVSCDIVVPDEPGSYSVRARYAQAYQGRLMTAEGRQVSQPEYQDVLGWWKVDRPDGPGPESAIGTITVGEPAVGTATAGEPEPAADTTTATTGEPEPAADATATAGEPARPLPVLDPRQAMRNRALGDGYPEHAVDTVLRLARPVIELRPAGEGEGPVIGYRGGRPPLDEDSWLKFIASVDCAALPPGALGIPLPEDGHLLFYASTDCEQDNKGNDGRVVYVPAGTAPPEGDDREAGEAVPLQGRLSWNLPTDHHSKAITSDQECARLLDTVEYYDLLYMDESYAGELDLGGHGRGELGDPCLAFAREGDEDWVVLAQADILFADFDDDGTGNATGFWVIRPRDLAEKSFERAKFLHDWNPLCPRPRPRAASHPDDSGPLAPSQWGQRSTMFCTRSLRRAWTAPAGAARAGRSGR